MTEIRALPRRHRGIAKLVTSRDRLARVELADGIQLPCDVLFAHPRQRQVDLVRSLGLATNPAGFVQIDEARRETSIPGIYAAGDLLTPMQGAIGAAASERPATQNASTAN